MTIPLTPPPTPPPSPVYTPDLLAHRAWVLGNVRAMATLRMDDPELAAAFRAAAEAASVRGAMGPPVGVERSRA